jgi:hypothetical protein
MDGMDGMDSQGEARNMESEWLGRGSSSLASSPLLLSGFGRSPKPGEPIDVPLILSLAPIDGSSTQAA